MAGYGGAIGGYTTPDGRVVQMPSDFARQFPALRPIAPPPTLPPPPGQGIGPQPGAPPADPGLPSAAAPPAPMTALPLPSGPAPVWTPEDSAELAKQTVQSTAAQSTPVAQPPPTGKPTPKQRGQKEAPPAQGAQGAQAAGRGAAPAGQRPMTDADLAKMGFSGPANAEQAAGEEEKAAIERHGQALADQATQVGDVMAKSEERANQLLEERKAEADRRQAALDAHTTWFTEQAKKIANTKIDRESDHPILAAIGIVLATIGTAMQNQQAALAAAFRGQAAPPPIENPAMKAFYTAIDRKVAAQMADLDNQRSALQLSSQGIGLERQAMGDRLTQMDVYRAGYLEQAKQQIERIKQQTQSPVIKANADMMKAQVTQKQADALGQSQSRLVAHMDQVAARNQAAQQHRESLAVTMRGQNMEQDRFQQQLAATEREKMAANAVALLKETNASAAAKLKRIEEGGLFDPRTKGRDPLLNGAGEAKMKQADQIEAQTRANPYQAGMAYVDYLKKNAKTDEERKNIAQIEARVRTDPAVAAQAGKEYATTLRTDARMNDAAVVSPKAAEELRQHIATAQTTTDEIQDVIDALKTDPAAWERTKWAGISTKLGNIANEYQKNIGERVSPRAFKQTMEHILEFDPDSWFHREVSQERAVRSLEELKGIVAGNISTRLAAEGAGSSWVPVARGQGERDSGIALGDKTAAERGEDESLGYLGRVTAGVLNANSVEQQAKIDKHAEYAMAPGAEGGLTPNAVTHIKALAAKAAAAGDEQHDQIVQSLAGSVSSGLKEGGRSGIAPGVLEVLRNSAPAIYRDVVNALPETDRKAVLERDALIRKAVVVPNKPSGFDPDAAAAEQAERDKQAARAAEIQRAQREKFGSAGAPR